MTIAWLTDKKKCTRRELRTGVFSVPPMLYGWIYPQLLMVFMIMSTYACIAPLLMPFCLFFFLVSYLMYKFQILYVYNNDYQSGGYMFYAVFDRSMISLLGGSIILLAYLAIRRTIFSGPFYLSLPLPFLICMFWSHCDKVYKPISEVIKHYYIHYHHSFYYY